jgi:hypothetical protein
MKTNLFSVTIKKHNNSTEIFHIKGDNIFVAIVKVDEYIQDIRIPGVSDAVVEEIKLIGKIVI